MLPTYNQLKGTANKGNLPTVADLKAVDSVDTKKNFAQFVKDNFEKIKAPLTEEQKGLSVSRKIQEQTLMMNPYQYFPTKIIQGISEGYDKTKEFYNRATPDEAGLTPLVGGGHILGGTMKPLEPALGPISSGFQWLEDKTFKTLKPLLLKSKTIQEARANADKWFEEHDTPEVRRKFEQALNVEESIPGYLIGIQGVKSLPKGGFPKINDLITKSRRGKISKLEQSNLETTSKILNPKDKLFKGEIGEYPRAVQEAAKVIKKSKGPKDLDLIMKGKQSEVIGKVNNKISKQADTPVNQDNILEPLRREIAEMKRDPQLAEKTKIFEKVLQNEEAFLNKRPLNLSEGQIRKMNLNKDLSNYLEKTKSPKRVEISENEALNLLREGYMKEVENVAGKEVGNLNRTYAGLSDARATLKPTWTKEVKALPPSAIEKIPLLRTAVKLWKGDVFGAMSKTKTLLDQFPKLTKQVGETTAKIQGIQSKLPNVNKVPLPKSQGITRAGKSVIKKMN